jgi:hypothetical protein
LFFECNPNHFIQDSCGHCVFNKGSTYQLTIGAFYINLLFTTCNFTF